MRVLLVGGTGPVGQATIPHLLAAGHVAAVAHSGAHEPTGLDDVEHLHGSRGNLLSPDGPVEKWSPEVIVDTFGGGATAAKAKQLSDLAERCGTAQVVAISSIDVYRHCARAGVDGNEAAEFACDALPLSEDASRRAGPSPGSGRAHDNVAMEDALRGASRITVLRPAAIYGPFLHPRVLREWYLVGKVARGDPHLPLPLGGTQFFHRVAVGRVGRALAAALGKAPEGRWACNVADPRDFTYGALAAVVAKQLEWEWQPHAIDWRESDHPWNVRHPVLADTTRLRNVLGVAEPDPVAATKAQIDWLWDRRCELSAAI